MKNDALRHERACDDVISLFSPLLCGVMADGMLSMCRNKIKSYSLCLTRLTSLCLDTWGTVKHLLHKLVLSPLHTTNLDWTSNQTSFDFFSGEPLASGEELSFRFAAPSSCVGGGNASTSDDSSLSACLPPSEGPVF